MNATAEHPDNHAPTEHSDVVGGSTAKRVMNCPRSVAELARFPKIQSDNDASRTGTMLHNAIAWLLDQDARPDPMTLVGMAFACDQEKNEQIVQDTDVIDTVIPALAAFDHYAKLCEYEGGLTYDIETRVQVKGIPGAFGTADIIGRTRKRSVVWDWKTGYRPVDAVNNEQLMFYAVGGMMTEETADLFEKDDDDWPVDLVICQPPQHTEAPGYAKHTVTVGALKDFRMRLIAAVAEAKSEDARRRRGSWCDYQPCKVDCPLWLNPLEKLVAVADGIDNAAQFELIDTAPVEEVEDELAYLYGTAVDLADLLEVWARDIKAGAQARLEAGLPVYGYRLAPSATHRKWADEKKAVSFLRRAGIKDKAVLYSAPKLLSPAQAEKAMKAAGVKLDGKVAEQFDRLCPKPPATKHTMVPADSKRPQANVTAANIKALAEKLSGQ